MLLSLLNIHTKVTGDCTCRKKFKFSIELFDAITGECILNQEFTPKSFRCKTVNTIYFKKINSRGIMSLVCQKIMNKNMKIKELQNVYIV